MKRTILIALLLIPSILSVQCQTAKTQDEVIAMIMGCPPPRPKMKGLGNLALGMLEKIGSSEYLNRMHDGIRRDFEDKGAVFDEIESRLQAKGISLEKKKDEDGNTKQILVSIDGDMSFDTGSAALTPKAKEMVSQMSAAMDAYPETDAKIHGHTDSTGSKSLNYRLSRKRAQAVANYLIAAKNISPSRIIEVKGFADDKKIIDTMRAEVRNRRVEIWLSPITKTVEDEGDDVDNEGDAAVESDDGGNGSGDATEMDSDSSRDEAGDTEN